MSKASEAAGLSRATVYRWRSEDADFAEAWDDKIASSVDAVEDVVFQQALSGNIEAAKLVLKAKRRDEYGDQSKVEHSGSLTMSGLAEMVTQ